MSENKAVKGIKKDFSLVAILLIPISIAINIVGGQLITALKLPIFLDSIGTILSGVLAGPWVGAITGLLSNLVNGIFDPSYIPYSIVSIVIGLSAGFLSWRKLFNNPWKTAISGIIISVVSTVVGTPITAFVYGGVTGSGNTFITGVLLATGKNLLQAVTTSVLIANVADKVLSVFIVFAIVQLIPVRLLTKFSLGEFNIRAKKKTSHAADADNMSETV